jgi:hypothetical protein
VSDGRTVWWSKDSEWWTRGRVIKLGKQFGPAGPAVLDWLTCQAKKQGPKTGHDGSLKTNYDALARDCFLDEDQAREIVTFAVALEVLDDFEDRGHDIFTLAATRKAEQRAKQQSDDVPPRPKKSRKVPETPAASAGVDDLPGRLPEDLHPVARRVHDRLTAIAAAKSVAGPTLARVGDVIADFPDHDHDQAVGDIADYWLHGGGARTERKDWVRVYRDWLKRVPAGGTVTQLRPNGRPEALTSVDAIMAAQNSRLEREREAEARLRDVRNGA